jgi:ribosome recycling factor
MNLKTRPKESFMSIKEQTEAKMIDALEHLKKDLQGIRTGRANPAMVTGVKVNVYGADMRLQDIAMVTAPEPRMLQITPHDKSSVAAIEKALKEQGFSPRIDGPIIRISIPAMDDKMRKEMIKTCHQLGEKAKIRIRDERQNGNKTLRKQKADGDIGEDVMNKGEKDIQVLTDKYCKMAEELCSSKEKEVSAV